MSAAVAEAIAKPLYRSSEELEMRALIEPVLRQRWPSARIVHEFSLRYSERRLDMAAITPTEIVGVEIKSGRDTLDRLAPQLRAFKPICTHLIVALAPKWSGDAGGDTLAERIIRDASGHDTEVWRVCSSSGTVDPGYPVSRRLAIWPAALLEALHVAELQRIAFDHGFAAGRTHRHALDACINGLTTPAALRAACLALRTRAAFAKGSDQPIAGADR